MTLILQGLDIVDTFLLSESPTQGGTLAFSQNSQNIFEKIRGVFYFLYTLGKLAKRGGGWLPSGATKGC